MKRTIDQTVLLIYCFATVLLVPADTAFLVAFLAAIIYGASNLYRDSRKWNLASAIVFLAISIVIPQFLLFTPLVLYGLLDYRQYILIAVLAGLYLNSYGPKEPDIMCFIALGCAVAMLIQYQTGKFEELEHKYRKTRDDGAELNLLLKEKNQNLLEKQDYEIYTATLRERNRIARKIHDNVGHMLSRSILMVGAMKAISREENLKEPLLQLEVTLNAAMSSVRQSVHDLHDESINMKEVLGELVGDFTFCKAHLEYDMGYDVPREIRYSFIMIVKEALNNVIKHSNATRVSVLAREHPGLYQLVIEDNGSVSGSEEVKDGARGIGIQNMKERIEALDGTIQIRKERGFRIYITVPKKEEVGI